MRLERHDATSGLFTFGFEGGEKEAFAAILEMYPVQHGLPETGGPGKGHPDLEHQELLRHSLDEHREELRSRMHTWLGGPSEVAETGPGLLKINREGIEGLLQVLNDLRVGHWILLGSPEAGKPPALPPDFEQMRCMAVMDLCGVWQIALIEALKITEL